MDERNINVRSVQTAANGRALGLAIAALLALAALTAWADRPPAPQPAQASPQLFSAQRAASVLRELVGSGVPHPLGSAADAAIRTQLVHKLTALGIGTELQEGWACDSALVCGRVVNVIGRIEGTEPEGATVLLAAHYDSVPAGPGAGDDGVGVASVLEIARVLRQQPARRHPVILLIDEGEEAGLLGAQLFVTGRPEARSIKAAVNLDARGDSGPSLMFETGPATDWSLRLFAAAASRPMSNSLYYFIYTLLPNDTDFTVFKHAGYEGFNFALIGGVQRYHTPQDRVENLELGSLQHQGQNALEMVQALAAADLSTPPATGAVFFDVFSRALWHWPVGWSLALGLVLSAALGGALWGLKRSARVSAPAVIYSLAAFTAAWAAAVLVCALSLVLVRAAGAVPPAAAYSWAAYPAGMHAACVALALLAPAWAVRLFARRIEPWSLWFAYLLLQAFLALLCAWKFPELSYLFFSPTLAGLIAALWTLLGSKRTSGPAELKPLAVIVPVVGAALTFIPILLLLYPGLGSDAWPAITALAGLAALGLAPLLRQSDLHSYRAYAWAGTAVVVLGVVLTLFMPAYSRQMPQRTLLWYMLDADERRAAWLLQPDSKRLPPQLALHAAAQASPRALPERTIAGPVLAAAPRLELAAPLLQMLGTEERGTTTLYHLHLRSIRNAPEIEVGVAGDRPVAASLDLAAGPLPAHFWRTADGSRWLRLIGVGPEGIDLTLEVAQGPELALTVLDRSYGVPPALGAPRRTAGVTTESQDGDLTIVYRSVRLGARQVAAVP